MKIYDGTKPLLNTLKFNSVKQGAVLSPVLFSMYLDQLISQVIHIGMGCYMNDLFTALFIYDDDINLLAPPRASLSLMLEQCDNFLTA